VALRGLLADLFEVAVIEDGHAHRHQSQFVDGLGNSFNAGGEYVLRGVTAQD
jgi:hypothetical protein